MKRLFFYAFCSILSLTSFATAQEPVPATRGGDANRYSSSRLENLVNDLKNTSVDLADRSSENLRGRSASRADIEAAFLAQQLDASVGFFQEFMRDNRRAAELRDGAAIISDLVRRASGYGSDGNLWRDAQRIVDDINRELGRGGGSGSGGGSNNGGGNSQAAGRAFWRGTVDSEVNLVIQNRNIETRTISGAPYANEVFSFTSSLPTRNVTVEAIKKSGRGQVRVLEQPNRDNDYTAVVQIIDDGGGAREYQLEIVWR